MIHDVIIIGAGPAGMTAAMYLARGGVDVVIVERGVYGGTLLDSDTIENYPGYPSIKGFELAASMESQLSNLKRVKHTWGDVSKVEKDLDTGYIKVHLYDEILTSRTVIVATGMEYRSLNIPGEYENFGKGVSNCVTCDMGFFQNKDVAIIGGGDTAVESAIYASKTANSVKLIHRRDSLRAEKHNQEKMFGIENISVEWDFSAKEIEKKERITICGEDRNIEVDGVFINVGIDPVVSFLPENLLNQLGYVIVSDTLETKMDGLFAIGDVREGSHKQIVSAAADGVTVASSVQEYLDREL